MICFGLVSLAAFAAYGTPFFRRAAPLAGGERTSRISHLPARVSHGHAAFQDACELCHTKPYGGVTNDACDACHRAGLDDADDVHPESKLDDPRHADRAAHLDARACVTCHQEHVPERTRQGGVTVAADFCSVCHADIGVERPSHAGFAASGCAQGGCHHFHDDRALYEAFLRKHLDEPDTFAVALVATRTPAAEDPAAPRALRLADADGPPDAMRDPAVQRDWAATVHAREGVNCTGCHTDAGKSAWSGPVDDGVCARCHGDEARGFSRGQHGISAAAGLGPVRVASADLPMRADAKGRRLGCTSCHGAHGFDPERAAVEACLGCHDDEHSRAYRASRHALLRDAERSGRGEAGSGVSCATCHMPRAMHAGGAAAHARVAHDQNENLRPRDKMLRGVCMSCHGLGFSIDALADEALTTRCFNGRPAVHVPSLEMAERRVRRPPQSGGATGIGGESRP